MPLYTMMATAFLISDVEQELPDVTPRLPDDSDGLNAVRRSDVMVKPLRPKRTAKTIACGTAFRISCVAWLKDGFFKGQLEAIPQ